jgi:cytochrome c oxidase assembly factor CtaG
VSLAGVFRTWMSDGTIAWIGLVLELVVAAAYLAAASRRSRRGSRWPIRRTAAFLAGLLVIAFALDSGIAARDDVPSVHMLQHALLMMLAPMLLAMSSPITLALRTMSISGRRSLLAVLHDPSVRGLAARPGVLIADYNVTMAIVLAAPVYRLGEAHLAIHVAVHGYLIFCGLLFWTAILARDPVPGRLPVHARLHSIALCVPLNLALAAGIALAPHVFVGTSRPEGIAAAQVLAAATTATSLLGMAIVTGRRHPGRALLGAAGRVGKARHGAATRRPELAGGASRLDRG